MHEDNQKKTSHDEWWEKIKAVSNANAKPVDLHSGERAHINERHATRSSEVDISKKPSGFTWKTFLLFSFLAIVALAPRLFFIYHLSDPENGGVGWNGDTYHHWQIGYMTYDVGLHKGLLRLWDLKGMEFFWGPLDPLLLSLIFAVSGNINIVITRLLSSFFGVGSLLLLSLLARRYWGTSVAVATFLFGIFFPIAIQSDASGMLEPFGVFFMLLGIYFWPRKPALTGVSWALASMVRAEAWIFSMGLLFALLFLKTGANKKIFAFIGWCLPMIIYMKYLLNYTGNPIYPLYWNFLANGLGEWADPSQGLTLLQQQVKPILMILGVFSGIILLLILTKKPKGYLLLLLGFGNSFFVTAFMGFSHYIKGWEWWFPLIRFFVFPYIFLAMVLFALTSMLSRMNKYLGIFFIFFAAIIVILISQITWTPLMHRFNQTVPEWQTSKAWGLEVGKYYQGGTVLFPDGDPNFTYTTVMYGKIEGKHILSQMFDPFYYLGTDAVFENWSKYRKRILVDWIKKEDIRMGIFGNDKRYMELIKIEPDIFDKIDVIPGSRYSIWRIYPDRINNDGKI